jgi:hypothetical protein
VSKQSLKALILLQNGALLTCKTLMEVYLIGMPFCVQNKQGEIVDDATEILKSLSLKSYEGGYKIMII